ncbi:hypothetical protein SISNIDRAFT_433507 [Sistotremastrum niveocremeum HHB9708]|uniref:cAMP-independent regulatory protein pac2 n=1 Tax=Sistotremastrum niveocremeum HHB9708 TaxID=1314777 RepID=A0A164NEX6_9AGAM|nr:hypothetical protein SISNIDRAFT_433507 [Sistotremastrum niveocremeum HHB9708]
MHCTHPCLHVRDVSDACIVFEAVRRGMLPLWKRRLNPTERDSLKAGNIFVWEEAEERGGLERWTDGRRWTQSRMRMDFLYYEETSPVSSRDKLGPKTVRRSSDDEPPSPTVSRRQDRPLRPDGLIKQTISTIVHTPGDQCPKKWHLVTYTSLNRSASELPVIDNYDYLCEIRVPPGIFASSRGVSWARDRYHSPTSSVATSTVKSEGGDIDVPQYSRSPGVATPHDSYHLGNMDGRRVHTTSSQPPSSETRGRLPAYQYAAVPQPHPDSIHRNSTSHRHNNQSQPSSNWNPRPTSPTSYYGTVPILQNPVPPMTHAPQPAHAQRYPHISSSSSSSSPSPMSSVSTTSTSYSSPSTDHSDHRSSYAPLSLPGGLPTLNRPSDTRPYVPLTSEDRRVLNTFNIRL